MSNYKVNSQKVISETLEGETIIINLETGNYYSMNDTGTVVWKLLNQEASTTSIISNLAKIYNYQEDNLLEKSVIEFLTFLQNNYLAIENSAPKEITLEEPPKNTPFTPPKVDKYEDMQEMLLADPIHDVDAIGWPKLKEDK